MIASFPWYDLPSVRWANDSIWRATGIGGELERATAADAQWRAADLIVSQACGLDLFLTNAPIEPVLAPVFDLDCPGGSYYSYLVGSRDGVAAVNSMSSRSGLSALLTICQPKSLIVTGSHTASLAAVRQGTADLACIDAVTWRILERDAPSHVRGLRVLDRTCSAPAPPYVARKAGSHEGLSARITAAMASPATRLARRALLLKGVKPVTIDDYAAVLTEYQAVADRIPDAAALR